jgi:hypothetical protein
MNELYLDLTQTGILNPSDKSAPQLTLPCLSSPMSNRSLDVTQKDEPQSSRPDIDAEIHTLS